MPVSPASASFRCPDGGHGCYGDHFGANWFHFIESQIEIWRRSFILLYLLSAAKAFWYSVPLAKGDRPCNAVVRDGRRVFRGAPMLLFFALGLVVAEAAPPLPVTLPPGHSQVCDEGGPSSSLLARRDISVSEDAELLSGTGSWARARPGGVYVSVVLLEFERHDAWVSIPFDGDVCSAQVLHRAREVFAECSYGRTILLVEPQPALGAVVLLGHHHGAADMGRVPVCVHVLRVPYVPFALYLDRLSSYDDLRILLGKHFHVGDCVCLGDSPYAIEEDELFAPRPGMLIRIIPEHAGVRPLRSLSFKLAAPERRLRQQVPSAAAVTSGQGFVFVLARLQDGIVIGAPAEDSVASLKSRIRNSCTHAILEFDAVPVGREVSQVAFVGRPAAKGVLIFPVCKDPQVPVVCDFRCVGFGIRLLFLLPGRCCLEQLLHLSQVPSPAGFEWHVGGSAFFDPSCRVFYLRHADTVVLRKARGQAIMPGRVEASCAGSAADQIQDAVRTARKLGLQEQLVRSSVPLVPRVYRVF